jgi:hypothetical protein
MWLVLRLPGETALCPANDRGNNAGVRALINATLTYGSRGPIGGFGSLGRKRERKIEDECTGGSKIGLSRCVHDTVREGTG